MPRKKQFQPVKGKLQISHRQSSGITYAIDLSLRDKGKNKKLISIKVPSQFDYSILNVIRDMLIEGALEIHGTTVDTNKT